MHTLGGAYIDYSYVLFESWGDGSFRPLLSIEIVGNEEKIKEIDYVIEQKRRDININVGGERTRQIFNNNNDVNIDQRESTRTDDSMVKRQSKSRLQLYNGQSIGDERAKRIKEIEETYDLASYKQVLQCNLLLFNR